jgi:hypothetical protein
VETKLCASSWELRFLGHTHVVILLRGPIINCKVSSNMLEFGNKVYLCGPPRGIGISSLHSASKALPFRTETLQCSRAGCWRSSLLPPITCNLPLHSCVAGAYLHNSQCIRRNGNCDAKTGFNIRICELAQR